MSSSKSVNWKFVSISSRSRVFAWNTLLLPLATYVGIGLALHRLKQLLKILNKSIMMVSKWHSNCGNEHICSIVIIRLFIQYAQIFWKYTKLHKTPRVLRTITQTEEIRNYNWWLVDMFAITNLENLIHAMFIFLSFMYHGTSSAHKLLKFSKM